MVPLYERMGSRSLTIFSRLNQVVYVIGKRESHLQYFAAACRFGFDLDILQADRGRKEYVCFRKLVIARELSSR